MKTEITQQQKEAAQDMFKHIDTGNFDTLDIYKRAESQTIRDAKKCKDNTFMYEIHRELLRLIRMKKKELVKKEKKGKQP